MRENTAEAIFEEKKTRNFSKLAKDIEALIFKTP